MSESILATVGQYREPVLERITRNVVETLGTVTERAGASCDLAVERPSPTVGATFQNAGAIVTQLNPTRVTEDVSVQFTRWRQPYSVHLVSIQTQQDPTPIDARLNRMLADCTAAVCRDRTRGGLALWTEVTDPEMELEDLNANGGTAVFNFVVEYETYRDDPFRSRTDPPT